MPVYKHRMLRRGRGNENTPADDRRRLPKVAGTLEADGKAAMTKQARAESSSPGERFLTLSEAAEVLRLSTRTVREYVKRAILVGTEEMDGGLLGTRHHSRPSRFTEDR